MLLYESVHTSHYVSFYFQQKMSEKSLMRKTALKRHEVARPIHIQRLEAALDIRPFVNQVERILNSDGGSDSDDDSDGKSMVNEMSKGDQDMHGVVTTKQGTYVNLSHLFSQLNIIESLPHKSQFSSVSYDELRCSLYRDDYCIP